MWSVEHHETKKWPTIICVGNRLHFGILGTIRWSVRWSIRWSIRWSDFQLFSESERQLRWNIKRIYIVGLSHEQMQKEIEFGEFRWVNGSGQMHLVFGVRWTLRTASRSDYSRAAKQHTFLPGRFCRLFFRHPWKSQNIQINKLLFDLSKKRENNLVCSKRERESLWKMDFGHWCDMQTARKGLRFASQCGQSMRLDWQVGTGCVVGCIQANRPV